MLLKAETEYFVYNITGDKFCNILLEFAVNSNANFWDEPLSSIDVADVQPAHF